ncbi:MAG TPA: NDP-sugar synthase [Clostridiaceae bacterium]|nr:NDP-sugar synthase [Clostridiaceae bacterium]
MKALFLAGGLGTRLKPITNELPKPMVPIMGKPLLERNIKNLKKHGIDEVILSTCYKPQKIREYFEDGSKFGVKISYICEDIPLGTGGAVKNAQEFFDDTFLVFNSDIISDINISEIIRFHKEKGALATIAATEVDNPSAYGVIEQDEKGFITAFKEKPLPHETNSNLINAGIYVFEPDLFNEIPAGRVVSIERETFPLLLEKGYKIAVYNKCSYWLDLGTPEKYMKAHKDILNGKLKIDSHNFNTKPKFISETAKIHQRARIVGPVYIGENVEIGDYAMVGPNTVLCEGSYVGMGAKVVGSIVWNQAVVESGASVINSVVMSKCRVDRNSRKYNAILTINAVYSNAV